MEQHFADEIGRTDRFLRGALREVAAPLVEIGIHHLVEHDIALRYEVHYVVICHRRSDLSHGNASSVLLLEYEIETHVVVFKILVFV